MSLTFDSEILIPSEGTIAIPRWSIEAFEPGRLYVPDDIADHFLIADVRVGTRSYLPNAHGVPARTFSESNGGCDFSEIPAEVLAGQAVTLVVHNLTKRGRRFQARLEAQAQGRSLHSVVFYDRQGNLLTALEIPFDPDKAPEVIVHYPRVFLRKKGEKRVYQEIDAYVVRSDLPAIPPVPKGPAAIGTLGR